MIRKELIALSGLMEMAVEDLWEGAPELNPVPVVSKKSLKTWKPRPRPLRPDQVKALHSACAASKNGTFYLPYATLLLETGMRRMKLLALAWDEVDLDRGVIVLSPERAKTAQGRTVVLTDVALSALKGLRTVSHTGSPFVFTNPATGTHFKSPGHGWGAIRKRAGVQTARLHDFRHTFSSWTRQMGLPKSDRMDQVGHTDDGTHEGYSESTVEARREAVNRASPSTLLAQHTHPQPAEGRGNLGKTS